MRNDSPQNPAHWPWQRPFRREAHITLARTENATCAFCSGDTELLAPCYPSEVVTEFDKKSSEIQF